MLSEKMTKAINTQINREIYSAYLYLGMASYAAHKGLNGIANWFNVQVQEELSHAKKMYDYVFQAGGRVMLLDIESPQQEFSSARELFEKTLAHEKMVTCLINKLVDIAKEEKDPATESFLKWFVTEQIEEETTPTNILRKMESKGTGNNGLSTVNAELGKRVFTPPRA
ncbi:MAG: ferritin [Candidatus Omnitrophota bacterium]